MKSIETIRILSATLSLLSISSIIYVDTQIAIRYVQADGKTKALFGIIELGEFSYKYLILVPAILSILLVAWIIRSKEFKIFDTAIVFVAVVAIFGTMTSSWKFLI